LTLAAKHKDGVSALVNITIKRKETTKVNTPWTAAHYAFRTNKAALQHNER